MLKGRFGDTSRRPYLEGRLLIPRVSADANISFCVDTGADSTVLMPADGITMNLDYNELTLGSRPSVGFGGITYPYEEEAVLIFIEPGHAIHVYRISLIISQPEADLLGLPSVLGRDILNQWRMRYSPQTGNLTFDVLKADYTQLL